MNTLVKEFLIHAVTRGTIKNLKRLFSNYKFKLDDSDYFDYELLKSATARGNKKIVNFLLTIGCRVENPSEKNSEETPLHLAAKNVQQGTDKIIKGLISKGASIYSKNSTGDTPLQAAFNARNFNVVEALLNNFCASYDPENEDDVKHFQIACLTNHYSAAEHFLECGFNPYRPLILISKEYADLNPIEFAIKCQYFELFKKLVKNNSNLLFMKNDKGLSIIHTIYYFSLPDNGKSWIEQVFDKEFVDRKDEYDLSHFHVCCTVDKPDFVKKFIDNGANINSSISAKSPLNAGFTPLHFAVKYDCKDVIEVLLENGADPNKADASEETPLHLACKKSENLSNGIIKILLEYKASPVSTDLNGRTPLHTLFYYAGRQYFTIFYKLISTLKWELVNYTDRQGLSLFHTACAANNVNQVTKFLDSGVNIDSRVTSGQYSGYTGLHFAVAFNQKSVAQELLKRNASVNARADASGMTPLHLACEFELDQEKCGYQRDSDQLEIVKLLLLHGADVDAKDSLGITPLLRACTIDDYDSFYLSNSSAQARDSLTNETNSRWRELFKILILNKADVNARTSDRSTILHIISDYRFLNVSRRLTSFLVNSGADVNAVNNAGLTPLHVAANSVNRKLVKSLLRHNANPNVKCKNSKIPLQFIVEQMISGNYYDSTICNAIICALLESGSDVNVTGENERTLLSDAILHLQPYLVNKLLNYGADVNTEDSLGNCCIYEILEIAKPGDEWMLSVWEHVFRIIFVHVQKLLALGLPVSENVQKCCLLSRYEMELTMGIPPSVLEDVFNASVKEVDKMKNLKIDRYTSLYEILLKSPQELAKYVKNKRFGKIVKDRHVDKCFPTYSDLLKIQFERGSKRSEVLQSANDALLNISQTHLPDACCDSIFKYLKNEDIVNLKVAAPAKCNLKRKLRDNNSDQAESVPKATKRN